MNPSKLLKQFLTTGHKPTTLRDQSAILDESRSLLVSKLPSTALTIQNMAEADIDNVLRGTVGTVLERAVSVHRAATKPAPAPNHIDELVQLLNDRKKVIVSARQKPAAFKPTAYAAKIPRQLQDKRQGALPLNQWAFGHLATAALASDKLATAELSARGYELNSTNTFSKRPL